jgi:hypothetical protein
MAAIDAFQRGRPRTTVPNLPNLIATSHIGALGGARWAWNRGD